MGFLDIIDIATDFVPGLAGVKKIADKAKVITDALGITKLDMASQYNQDPEAFIQQLKNKATEMEEATKQFALEVEDKKSARAMAEKIGLTPLHYMVFFACLLIIMTGLGVVAYDIYKNTELSANTMLTMIVSSGITVFVGIAGFLYGSSAGSKQKNKSL